MIIDGQLQFSSAQAVTATAASTNQIDLGVARSAGAGERMYVYVGVSTALVGAGTVAVIVQGATDAAFTSPVEMQSLGTIPAASAIGTRLVQSLGISATSYRYIRLYYTVSGSVTAGAVTAEIVKDADLYTAYADNSRIS